MQAPDLNEPTDTQLQLAKADGYQRALGLMQGITVATGAHPNIHYRPGPAQRVEVVCLLDEQCEPGTAQASKVCSTAA